MADEPFRVRPLASCLLAAWCAAVWFLSDQPDPARVVALPIELPDYVLHFVEYAVGGALAAAALRGREPAGDVLLALGFCALYALLDEWHQSFVPGRDPSGTDVAADLLGACAGACVSAVVPRARASAGTGSDVLQGTYPP